LRVCGGFVKYYGEGIRFETYIVKRDYGSGMVEIIENDKRERGKI